MINGSKVASILIGFSKVTNGGEGLENILIKYHKITNVRKWVRLSIRSV